MFKSLLSKVPEQAGDVLGIALVSLDGIAIEKIHTDTSVNLDSLIAEFTDRMKRSQQAEGEMGIGTLREQVIHADGATVILRSVHDEYFILCAAKPDGLHGKVRHAMRMVVPDLAQELV